MKIRKFKSALITLLLLASTITAQDRGPFTLKYTPQKGKPLHITRTREVTRRNTFLGNESTLNSTDEFKFQFNLSEKTTDGTIMDIIFKDLTCDSDDPQFISSPDISSLKGKTVKATLHHEGTLDNFEDLNKLPNLIVPGLGQLNEEKTAILLSQIFPHLPEENVTFGDSWQYTTIFTEHENESVFNVTVNYTYTLDSITRRMNRPCLKILSTYTLDVKGSGRSDGMNFSASIPGNGKETIYFDQKTGMLIEVVGEAVLQGEIQFEDEDIVLIMDQKFKDHILAEIK